MGVAPSLNRDHQDFMLTECGKLMLAGKAAEQGLFWIDRDAVQSVHDFLMRNEVLKKPVDPAGAYDRSFLEAIATADRRA
jgi:NitT/TauT family transport system substrate-binding protein